MTPLAEAWPDLVNQMRRHDACVVATDFDGTLVPLADCPGDVVMAPRARRVLGRLASRPGTTVALVSGRMLAELDALVGLSNTILVGNHGFEVRVPGKPIFYEHVAHDIRISRVLLIGLRRYTHDIPGLWIEDKGPILAVHLRLVAPADVQAATAIVHDAVSPYRSSFHVALGRQVLEIRPNRAVSKGSALCGALSEQGVPTHAMCWYFGDDTADEEVFRSLPDGSVTVHVGGHRPDSAARFEVDKPATVLDVLDAIDEVAASIEASGNGGSDLRLEVESDAVDAVPESGGRRSVWEHMS
jgi:trehalose 6-phosphate phosphatase